MTTFIGLGSSRKADVSAPCWSCLRRRTPTSVETTRAPPPLPFVGLRKKVANTGWASCLSASVLQRSTRPFCPNAGLSSPCDSPMRQIAAKCGAPRVVVRGSLQDDGFDGPGGWNQGRDVPDYAAVVRLWRKQTPNYEHITTDPSRATQQTDERLTDATGEVD